MVLESIRAFFSEKMAPPDEAAIESGKAQDHPTLQVAACALLLEIAYADDEFADSERAHLEKAMRRHFALDDETASQLIEFADQERRRQIDLHQFTRLISQNYSHAQKMVLLEAMWGLVCADGEVAKHETMLMRKLSHLLGVKAAFLSEARKKAAPRHD